MSAGRLLDRPLAAALLIGGACAWAACSDPAAPPDRTLDGTYVGVMSAYGPPPIRFDYLLDPPDAGEWWFMWMEEVTISFSPEGTYEMVQLVQDSFPRTGDTAHRTWHVVGTYDIQEDTVLSFTMDPEESFSNIGVLFGRIRADQMIWTDMFGLTFMRVEE